MKKPIKQPLNLRMDLETIEKLKLHAVLSGYSASDVVTYLVREHLKPVVVLGVVPRSAGDTGPEGKAVAS